MKAAAILCAVVVGSFYVVGFAIARGLTLASRAEERREAELARRLEWLDFVEAHPEVEA